MTATKPLVFRRRLEGKTDYNKRRKILRGRLPALVVRISNKNIIAQLIRPTLGGDTTIAHTHSRELLRHGWKGSRKSIPAAYLVGYTLGFKGVKTGTQEAILYVGVGTFTPRGRVTAVMKGALDAGLKVRVDTGLLPEEERLTGVHVAKYAEALKKAGAEAFQSRFGAITKAGGNPSDYPKIVESVKNMIREAFS